MAFTQNSIGTPCGSCLDYCFTDDEYAALTEEEKADYSVTATVILDGVDIVTIGVKVSGGSICFSVTDIVLEYLQTPCPSGVVSVLVPEASALLQIRLENSLGTTFTTAAERVLNAVEDPMSGFLMAQHQGADWKFLSNNEKNYFCEGGQLPYLYAYLLAGGYTVDDGFSNEVFTASEDGVYAIPIRTDLAVATQFTVQITGGPSGNSSSYTFQSIKNEDCCCDSFKFLGKKGGFEHLSSNCILEGMLNVERKAHCEYIPCNVDPSKGGRKTHYANAHDEYKAVSFMHDDTWGLRQWFKEFLYSEEIYFFDCELDSYVRIILTGDAYLVYDRFDRKLGVEFSFRYANSYKRLPN